ncbi:helix-turn-helix domain-containing protein [Limnoglobus roseus]|uniref:DNA-binding protein n=1 Tax=Limnoglobus roseus TaxID=2598579 RepID=A0A5C1AJT1_9BACT|nr:DNA-binding protein [Limnoglobus roseus]
MTLTHNLSVKQAALAIGVCESLIRDWCADGMLPHYRVGRKGKRGKILISTSDLAAFLEQLKIAPAEPKFVNSSTSSAPGPLFSELDSKRLAKAWLTR